MRRESRRLSFRPRRRRSSCRRRAATEHLDQTVLGHHRDALPRHRDDLSRVLAAHGSKAAGEPFARVEDLQPPLTPHHPGQRARGEAADQSVDEIDMARLNDAGSICVPSGAGYAMSLA
jgi:hypothetical protein